MGAEGRLHQVASQGGVIPKWLYLLLMVQKRTGGKLAAMGRAQVKSPPRSQPPQPQGRPRSSPSRPGPAPAVTRAWAGGERAGSDSHKSPPRGSCCGPPLLHPPSLPPRRPFIKGAGAGKPDRAAVLGFRAGLEAAARRGGSSFRPAAARCLRRRPLCMGGGVAPRLLRT